MPLAQVVLVGLLADPLLGTYQAELITRVLKESTSMSLAADVFSAAADVPAWGASWNESTVTVLTQMLDMRPRVSEVRLVGMPALASSTLAWLLTSPHLLCRIRCEGM